jgi:hypothetical protein
MKTSLSAVAQSLSHAAADVEGTVTGGQPYAAKEPDDPLFVDGRDVFIVVILSFIVLACFVHDIVIICRIHAMSTNLPVMSMV